MNDTGSKAPPRLYRLALRLYPPAYRARYAEEIWQTCRDMAEQRQGVGGAPMGFWLAVYTDLVAGALRERGVAMRALSWSVILAVSVTLAAVTVSVAAGLILYGLEDGNPLTAAAYSASPLLRLSYDGAYLAALAAAVAGAAIILYAVAPARVALGGAVALAAVVALGGFGGLLARRPLNGLALIGAFAGLVALCLLAGWSVARALEPRQGARAARLIGACAGAGVALALDTAVLIAHVLTINPVSHALYMQGQIGATHLNALLASMAAQALALGLWGLCVAVALWSGKGAPPPERIVAG